MKKQFVIAAMAAMFTASALPALSVCPCNPCESCAGIYTTAGVANYDKALNRTNYGVIKKESNLNDFEKLIKKAGLKEKIDKGNYTVFAPTNEAIKNMQPGRLDYLQKAENKDELVKFVMAHMATGKLRSECLCEQQKVVNLNCCEIQVEKCNNWMKIGDAQIIAPNISTKNGEVHIIDHVLEPYA